MGYRQKINVLVLLSAVGAGPASYAAAFDANEREGLAGTQALAQAGAPLTRDALFGDDRPAADKPPPGSGWRGFVQGEAARMYQDPQHWSNQRLRLELNRKGQFSENVKWTIGGRVDYDFAYTGSSFYPPLVRDDQRREFMWRENYLDITAGDLEFRLGRQHVVWGEMVGLFFADVVSAKDLQQFILPEFGQLRIPQWAARAEYFTGNLKAEVLWIPVPSFDNIGKPGADFYPYPLPVPASYLPEDQPDRKPSNMNYGLRLSHLKDGWDISGFYYHSVDAAPAFYRLSAPGQPIVFQPRHEKIDQAGGTLAKDLGSVVLKAEFVYTNGRKFSSTRPTQVDGLVRQNTIDYAIGLDFNLPADVRLNVQFFQRHFFSHDSSIIPDSWENGASILLNGKPWANVEAQALFISSLNRSDWMFRPQVFWNFEKNWRLTAGVDVFSGPITGFFGRYNNNDRVYAEVRYSF